MKRNCSWNSALVAAFMALLITACGSGSPTEPGGGGNGGGGTSQEGPWNWSTPSPNGNAIRAVQFASATTVYAVTDPGTVLKSVDAGKTWGILTSVLKVHAEPYAVLWDLHFIDENRGWVVGTAGQVSYTDNGGLTWMDRSVPNSPGPIPVYDVFFHDAMNGFVVSDRSRIFRTSDGGLSWTLVFSQSPGERFWVIVFPSPTLGFAGGEDGLIVTTQDGGTTWTVVPTGWTDNIRSASAVGDAKVAFGTDTGKLLIGNGVGPWAGGQFAGIVSGIHFVSEDVGVVSWWSGNDSHLVRYTSRTEPGVDQLLRPGHYAGYVAMSGSNIVIAGGGGYTSYSSDDGASWGQVRTDIFGSNPPHMYSVGFVDENKGISVGTGGAVLTTNDGGLNWQFRSTGMGGDLYGVWYGENAAFAVGPDSTVLRSTDDGLSWTRANIVGTVAAATYYAVAMWDASTGIIGGSRGNDGEHLLMTDDGGITWQAKTRGPTSNAQSYQAVAVLGAGRACLGGLNGTVVYTHDSGVQWSEVATGAPGHILSVWFIDEQNGWLGTAGAIAYTTDAGMTWTRAVGNVNADEVRFADPNIGLAVGSSGRVFRSDDGGRSWVMTSSGIDSNTHIQSLWMHNANDAVICGNSGYMLYTRCGGRLPGPKL